MSQMKVVIADDESIIRLDLKTLLEEMGHMVVGEAADGERALEVARSLKPDVVIMDIKMPVMDGLDAAKIIAEEKIAPVVLLTAYSASRTSSSARRRRACSRIWSSRSRSPTCCPRSRSPFRGISNSRTSKSQLGDLEEKLETRKLVDRAKGILMDKYQMNEAEAFRSIQQQ